MGLERVESGDLVLRRGDRDAGTQGAVSEMQQFLINQGFDLPQYGVDGRADFCLLRSL